MTTLNRDLKSDHVIPSEPSPKVTSPKKEKTIRRISVKPKLSTKPSSVGYLSTTTAIEIKLSQLREDVVFPSLIMTTFACPSRFEAIKVCLLGDDSLQKIFLSYPECSQLGQKNCWTTTINHREFEIHPWTNASNDFATFFDHAAILLFFSKANDKDTIVPRDEIKKYCQINHFLHIHYQKETNKFSFKEAGDFETVENKPLDPRVANRLQKSLFKHLPDYMVPPLESAQVNAIPFSRITSIASTQKGPTPTSSGAPTNRSEQPTNVKKNKCCIL